MSKTLWYWDVNNHLVAYRAYLGDVVDENTLPRAFFFGRVAERYRRQGYNLVTTKLLDVPHTMPPKPKRPPPLPVKPFKIRRKLNLRSRNAR